MKKWILAFSLLVLSSAYAARSSSQIQHLQQALDQAKQQTQLKIAFPKTIPSAHTPLYATFTHSPGGYFISIDSTPLCQGAKYCMVGALKVEASKNPVLYFDRNKMQKTVTVNLSNNIQGYYTPGFAMADFWPANIQWKLGNTLYTITWSNTDKQAIFVKMANSVIEQLH